MDGENARSHMVLGTLFGENYLNLSFENFLVVEMRLKGVDFSWVFPEICVQIRNIPILVFDYRKTDIYLNMLQ